MAGEQKITGPDLAVEGILVDALRADIPAVGHVAGEPVIVVLTADGPRAVGGRCTHYGGPLSEGLGVDGQVRCPWHHAAFDLQTGEAAGAPALDPIPVFDLEVRDGRAFVTKPRQPAGPASSPAAPPEAIAIVGAGAGGAAAAEALRRLGYEGPISLIGDEAPVDRPNLSKDYLAGTAQEDWMPLRSPEFYADAAIHLIVGEQVTAIDRTSRVVHLAGGRSLSYDSLLLAPGAEPRRLPVPGAELPHVRYLRTLADSKAVVSALHDGPRVVVIGAGFIGLEVAASLRHRGIAVTVVAPEEIPLAPIIGETLGRFVGDLHREHGVVFRTGNVDRIDEREVWLRDGTAVPADLVVVGIGVTPRTELAAAAGLIVDNGIVVDDRLRTSDPQIWAAGDAARFPGPEGTPVRVEHWVLAERHGQAAARNMLGRDVPFTEPPFFWSQHYDVTINVTGHLAGWDEEVVVGEPNERNVLVAYKKAGSIRAVATIHRDRDNLRAELALARGDQRGLEQLLQG